MKYLAILLLASCSCATLDDGKSDLGKCEPVELGMELFDSYFCTSGVFVLIPNEKLKGSAKPSEPAVKPDLKI